MKWYIIDLFSLNEKQPKQKPNLSSYNRAKSHYLKSHIHCLHLYSDCMMGFLFNYPDFETHTGLFDFEFSFILCFLEMTEVGVNCLETMSESHF